jgi:hypothetical protein
MRGLERAWLPFAHPWSSARGAWTVDVYRVLVGLLLCEYFVTWFVQLPGLWPEGATRALRLFELTRALGLSASLGITRFWFAGSALLAAALAVGVRPRACAALLLASCVMLSRGLFPITTLDDHVACVASFWLCLLPTGRTLTWSSWKTRDHWHREQVEGWTACALMVHVILLLVDADLWREYSPSPAVGPVQAATLCVVAGCLVIPSIAVRCLGVAGLCLVSFWLARFTELRFAHAFIAASAALFWGAPRAQGTRFALTVPAAAGCCALVLSACLFVASKARADAVAQSIAQPLWHLGLLPRPSGQKRAATKRLLQLRSDASAGKRIELLAADLAPGIRAELLRSCLAQRSATSHETRAKLTRALIELRCADAGPETGELWLKDPSEATALAWYECGTDYRVRHLVLAESVRTKEVSPQTVY